METRVRLPDELREIILDLGFSGDSEFIEEAVKEKILELKRQKFFKISDKVASGLESKGISSKEILDDFSKK